jgi:DNA-binding protein HU-beta
MCVYYYERKNGLFKPLKTINNHFFGRKCCKGLLPDQSLLPLSYPINPEPMNKGELVASIADNAGLTQSQAESALSATLDAIQGALKGGDSVSLVGFGTFSASERPAREGRNPRTGETIQIKAKTVAKFKPGKKLSDSLN